WSCADSHERLAVQLEGDDVAIARGRVAQCPDAGDLRVREDRAVELCGFLGFLVEPEMRCNWFHRLLPSVSYRPPLYALAEQRIEQLIALLHAVGHAGRHRRVPSLLRPEVDQR